MDLDSSKSINDEILSTTNSNENLIKLENENEKVDKKKGTSNLETLMHMVKANIGTGVLAMPLAFKNAGFIFGSIWLWIMAIICVHCMHILLECYNYVTKKKYKNDSNQKISDNIGYDDVVYLIFKDKLPENSAAPARFRLAVSVFLVIGQLGFCCVYLVFVPTNLKEVIDYHHPKNGLSVQILMCIILLPMIVFCLIKNLKILAPFSTFANFLMIGSMFVILYELFFNGGFKPFSELDMVAPFKNWPTYFSSAIYAFEGISLVLPVHHEMRNKERFSPWNGVLNTAMSLVAVMYFTIGFFGYLKYGQDSLDSITLNLPVSNIACQIVKILFSIAIFISYNLQFYVAAEIIWSYAVRRSKYLQSLYANNNKLNETNDQSDTEKQAEINKSASKILILIEYAFRSSLVIFTFLLAVSIPKIGLFISLVGAVASSTLAIIIPPILDLIVFWPSSKSKVKLVKNAIIIIFGLYIFLAGTYVSLSDIVDYLKS